MNIENAARDKLRKFPNVAVPLNPAAIRSIHPDHFGRRASIRIDPVALLEQSLRLAAGKLGIGIAPERELTVLIITPDAARFRDDAFIEAGGVALRHDCTHELTADLLNQAAKRVVVRAIPENRRGRKCVDAIEALVKEVTADLLILHDACVYFSGPAVAAQQLRRGLGVPAQPEAWGVQPISDGGDLPPAEFVEEPNTAIFTGDVLRKGMPDDEAGPAAWIAHQPSAVHLLRDAALSIAGRPGLYDSDRTHRVVIFAPLCSSHLELQSAIASLLPHLSPPTAAWHAIAQVRWIPVSTTTSMKRLAEYLRAEADACGESASDFVIVLWQFHRFRLTTLNAAEFLSRAILGYESVIS
jgi:hypothetical protein